MDLVNRLIARFLVEEKVPELFALVMVPHNPNHSTSEPLGSSLNLRTKSKVCLGETRVGKVTRQQDRIRPELGSLQLSKRGSHVRVAVDLAIQQIVGGDKMRVTHVDNEAAGSFVRVGHGKFLRSDVTAVSTGRG
jgi:hypothetical protein